MSYIYPTYQPNKTVTKSTKTTTEEFDAKGNVVKRTTVEETTTEYVPAYYPGLTWGGTTLSPAVDGQLVSGVKVSSVQNIEDIQTNVQNALEAVQGSVDRRN